MQTHYLKTIQPFFDDLWYGYKTFEIRKNDRDYQIGDLLILNEFVNSLTTNRRIVSTISYIVTSDQFPDGLQPGYCVLGLENINPQKCV